MILAPALWIGLALLPQDAESSRMERLSRVIRLWGTVKFLHPYLAYKEIDWDAALVAAIPKVNAAKSCQEYSAAVQSMLDALQDAATHVVRDRDVRKPENSTDWVTSRWVEEGILDVRVDFPESLPRSSWEQVTGKFMPEFSKSKIAIFDLRGSPRQVAAYFDENAAWMVPRKMRKPAQRYRTHSGYRPHRGESSGGYYSAFVTEPAEELSPPAEGQARRIVFLVDETSAIPAMAPALQASGDGLLVAEGKIHDESLVEQEFVDLGEGVSAVVRETELVPFEGFSGLRADAEAKDALQTAVRLAKDAHPRDTPKFAALPEAVWRSDKGYEDMSHPAKEYRILALARFWNITRYFYPYKHLIEDWDAVLLKVIPGLEKARDAREYHLAIAELATLVADGHTSVWSSELQKHLGEAGVPLDIRLVEGLPVVHEILDEDAGVEVGDVILEVDGEPAAARMERYGKLLAASTPEAHAQGAARNFLRGPPGLAVLKIRNRADKEREVQLRRESRFLYPEVEPKGEAHKIIPDNIGYADLRRLRVDQVDAMFAALRKTRGIIFDRRGYPQGTAWSIAPRINTRGARWGAMFFREVVAPGDRAGRFQFFGEIPSSSAWKYEGKTVMLIDDRAISQAEHTGLLFEAANNTRFIGTATAGANGDVTDLILPGGISVFFTGHDVRHADGRQLQRIGLVPHIEVKPTLAGIRAGRDEVLERAVKYLQE